MCCCRASAGVRRQRRIRSRSATRRATDRANRTCAFSAAHERYRQRRERHGLADGHGAILKQPRSCGTSRLRCFPAAFPRQELGKRAHTYNTATSRQFYAPHHPNLAIGSAYPGTAVPPGTPTHDHFRCGWAGRASEPVCARRGSSICPARLGICGRGRDCRIDRRLAGDFNLSRSCF